MKYLVFLVLMILGESLQAQVYSPKLLAEGQPDPTDLKKFVTGIYAQAHAETPSEKAEAIWRFFLTDGRFVPPGFWYHIAGWAYEEPYGEVLDPIKLLNSYGFGLCYHIAPLLQAMFEAGGFQDARCWFLTGHTVAEVFYSDSYHYYDSDMMGYNVVGDGPYQGKAVSSVRQLERDPSIILGKLSAPDQVKPGTVPAPWYPADVRAKAMTDLAELFTSSSDNYLYAGKRYSEGHQMNFTLRHGEKLIRYFAPEERQLYYLPYKFDGSSWSEFPQPVPEFGIRTENGPQSQKDARLWATGRLEYRPPFAIRRVSIIPMPSPYVVIDAQFRLYARLEKENDFISFETSTDRGITWVPGGRLSGRYKGLWVAKPKVLSESANGRLTAVSGSYGYWVRIRRSTTAMIQPASLLLLSRFQLNPRSLPAIRAGANRFVYSADDDVERVEIPGNFRNAQRKGLDIDVECGNQLLALTPGSAAGEAVYRLAVGDQDLRGFEVGARFLDLGSGLAPEKRTAETRKTGIHTAPGEGKIEWALSPGGPFKTLWNMPPKPASLDNDPVERILNWPQAFEQVRTLPAHTKQIFVKLRTTGPAVDDCRFAVYTSGTRASGSLHIVQIWREDGVRHEHRQTVTSGSQSFAFPLTAGSGRIENEAVVFALP